MKGFSSTLKMVSGNKKVFEMWRNTEKHANPSDNLYWNTLKKQTYSFLYLNGKLKYGIH